MKGIIKTIFDKIGEYDRIMLFRHARMDGDCVGAAKGLKAILQLTYPEKEIYLTDGQYSDYLAFMGPDDAPVPDAMYADALGIVLDTSNVNRISNQKYALCRELIKIDHHIEVEPFGDYSWVEPERSSACEMIAAFYEMFRDKLKINSEAASYLYTGIVTDSGCFRHADISGDTFRLAGLMLDIGVDVQTLYAHLYLNDFESLRFKAYVYDNMHRTEHGVAYIYIGHEVCERFGLSYETACASVSYMDGIRGALCWILFVENDDAEHSIRVRLRSRFMTVNALAERYRGGGHACACGATVYSKGEMAALLDEADALIKDYKEHNDGWL